MAIPMPFGPTNGLLRELERPFRMAAESLSNHHQVRERDGELVLTVDLPGFNKDEISITWDDGVLQIDAAHTNDEYGREKSFHRRFRITKDVEPDDIEASYNNGVLEVRVPVDEETNSGTEIPIDG